MTRRHMLQITGTLERRKRALLLNAIDHFGQKGARLSRKSGNGCFYRLNGKATGKVRCAIGASIPDNQYRTRYDRKHVSLRDSILTDELTDEMLLQDIMQELGWFLGLEGESKYLYDFAEQLQCMHDGADSVKSLREDLRRIARSIGCIA
jgi:hypothetical protein